MKEKIELEISTLTIVKIILVLASIYLLFFIKDILLLLFLVFILVSTFSPVVNRWEKKIKRVPAVLALVVIGIAILSFFTYIIVPPLVYQFGQFVSNLPNILNSYKDILQASPIFGSENVSAIFKSIGDLSSGFLAVTINIFGGIFAFLMVIVLSIYMLIDQRSFNGFFVSLVPIEKKEAVVNVVKKISTKVGNWFMGQIALCLIIGALDFIGLVIIGVPYALALAVISGILEIIPTIGPIVAGIITALIALTISPLTALAVIILYVIVQQLENTIIVPKVMQKAVGLSPVVIIIAVLIGAKLFGFLGALIAVPVAASISVIAQEWDSIKAIVGRK